MASRRACVIDVLPMTRLSTRRVCVVRLAILAVYRAALDRWSGGDWELFQELLWALRKVGNRHGGASIANVAAAWVLYQLGPAGGWVILGVRDATHLDEHSQLVADGGLTLDDDDVASIGAVLAKGKPPKGDIWSHERGYA